jgi:hypothetical protein
VRVGRCADCEEEDEEEGLEVKKCRHYEDCLGGAFRLIRELECRA